MNVQSIYEECGRLLNDPQNDRWNQNILLSRINLAQTKVLAYTNAIKTLETLTPTATNPEVQLDTDVIDIIRVDIIRPGGEIVKLRGYLREQLDFDFPNWQQLGDGAPLAYWWDGTNQKINLVPAPDAANVASNSIKVWEVQNSTDLTGSSDVPFASNSAMVPYHLAIVHWVVAQCWMDDATPEALAKSKFHRSGQLERPGQFELELMRIIAKFDAPEDIPLRILWKPTGGRLSSGYRDRKGFYI